MNSTHYFFTLVLVGLLGTPFSLAQTEHPTFQIAFYNVENLFDPQNDSTTNDDSFTPEGFNHWTYSRFRRKINNISKVFIAMGDTVPPDIIGMAEIENEYVLKQLCYNSPLNRYKYRYVHFDSPDARGIEVALLYRPERIKIINKYPIHIQFPFEPHSKNRDILYCQFLLNDTDTLNIFVNHWTSRYSGYATTIPKRNFYAQKLRESCDSLLGAQPMSKIVIMGDFNDYPTDESLYNILRAKEQSEHQSLTNLMLDFNALQNLGTHKREDFWGCLDQIIVSHTLLDENSLLAIPDKKAHIFKADFMMQTDEKYGGEKVFRTYLGPKYFGGYSDHLPVYILITHFTSSM